MTDARSLLRHIPSVNAILQDDDVKNYEQFLSFPILSDIVSSSVNEMRQQLIDNRLEYSLEHKDEVYTYVKNKVINRLQQKITPSLSSVINATGVVLHTNLGRARLSHEAVSSIQTIANSYSNLEYRIDSGERGSRHEHLEQLLCLITGAEAAMVVNNNAAAVYLVLNELAGNKEAIVSRGQLVEIGGSFRVSEIMKLSGVKLVEVGTTNKTHVYDYERAITDETALLMKVHTSNFRLIGFTEAVDTETLVSLGQKHEIPVYEDVGSGVLIDLRPLGIKDEPTVQEVIRSGVDVISFSGDKLLGGPQAGIIVGKKKWIDRLKKNQLARVLRVDKLTIAALQTTLLHYAAGDHRAKSTIPVLKAMFKTEELLQKQAEQLSESLTKYQDKLTSEIVCGRATVGGGSLPGFELPSVLVSIKVNGKTPYDIDRLLRTYDDSVIGRIQNDQYLLDMRTVEEEEIPIIVSAIIDALL